MKKLFSIFLIMAFLVQSTSQLWVLLSFKINQEYISTNLCVNRFDAIPLCKGSCILEKELNQHQEQQEKFPDLKWKEISLFCQDFTTQKLPSTISFNSRIKYPLLQTDFISASCIRSVFRPPSIIV